VALTLYLYFFHCSGGSSGGECALLALDGAAMGVRSFAFKKKSCDECVFYQAGSDIGGSLKIPASYCGVYSFNPSFGRISRLGIGGQYYAYVTQLLLNSNHFNYIDPNPGFNALGSVFGPMSRYGVLCVVPYFLLLNLFLPAVLSRM